MTRTIRDPLRRDGRPLPSLPMTPPSAPVPSSGLTDEERDLLRRLTEKQRGAPASASPGGQERDGDGTASPSALASRLRAGGGWPWTTIGLCVVWIVLFFVMRAAGDGTVTVALIERFGGLDNAAVRAGEWHRLVTAAFLHASLVELVFHVWFLFTAGRMTERLIGGAGLLLHFVLSAAGAGVVVIVRDGSTSLLSEGATFGVIGGLMGLYFRHRSMMPPGVRGAFFGFVPLIIIYAILTYAGYSAGMDPNELFGGLAAGLALPFVLPRLGVFQRPRPAGAPPAPAWRRWAAPFAVSAIILLAWTQVLVAQAGWRAPRAARVAHPDGGWGLELPPGFAVTRQEGRLVQFGREGTTRVFRARLDAELVNAPLDHLRARLDRRYRRLTGATTSLDALPLANTTWIVLREVGADGTLAAAAASEASARLRGVVLEVAAPPAEAERAWVEFLHAAATFAEEP